jgi:serine protein kinase
VAANPVHLLYVLEQQIMQEQFPREVEEKYIAFIKGYLARRYAEYIGKEIQTAYLESYSEYGQNIFDRYVTYADYWIQDEQYRDPDTGEMVDRAGLNAELERIEKPAGISNPKDFRNEIVNFTLRARAANGGQSPSGPATRSCVKSSSRRCSRTPRNCCRSSPSMPSRRPMTSRSTAILSSG